MLAIGGDSAVALRLRTGCVVLRIGKVVAVETTKTPLDPRHRVVSALLRNAATLLASMLQHAVTTAHLKPRHHGLQSPWLKILEGVTVVLVETLGPHQPFLVVAELVRDLEVQVEAAVFIGAHVHTTHEHLAFVRLSMTIVSDLFDDRGVRAVDAGAILRSCSHACCCRCRVGCRC